MKDLPNDYNRYKYFKKYRYIISFLSITCVTIAISFQLYRKPFEDKLREKDKEIKNIKSQLKFYQKELEIQKEQYKTIDINFNKFYNKKILINKGEKIR